jgi:hypothetical protein
LRRKEVGFFVPPLILSLGILFRIMALWTWVSSIILLLGIKRHGKFNIKEHLDWGLSNHLWVLLFPNSHLTHLPALEFDHNPLLLSTSENCPNISKPLKFEAF